MKPFVKRAEYARMKGWHRSYVSKLERDGRVVLSDDGRWVDVAASDALLGHTADPSKTGVRERWAEQRRVTGVYVPAHADAPAAPTPVGAAASLSVDEQSFQSARASREFYNGQMVKLEYEWVTGLLVSRLRVDDAGQLIGRSVRDRVLGLSPRIAPELAALTDAWELEKKLTNELRQVLDDLVRYFAMIMADISNDPGRGKLPELARLGRERYGTDEKCST